MPLPFSIKAGKIVSITGDLGGPGVSITRALSKSMPAAERLGYSAMVTCHQRAQLRSRMIFAYSDENGRANRVKMGDFRLHLFESERSDAGIFSIYPFRFFSCALIHLLNLAGESYERCDREWHRRWLVHR
jgi:hypothetical protein